MKRVKRVSWGGGVCWGGFFGWGRVVVFVVWVFFVLGGVFKLTNAGVRTRQCVKGEKKRANKNAVEVAGGKRAARACFWGPGRGGGRVRRFAEGEKKEGTK